MNSVKKVPTRKCVACGALKPKKELVRIIRTPEGNTEFDPTGRKNGKGAYICNSLECLAKAKKNKNLSKALEAQISDEVYAQLEKELKSFEENDKTV